MSQATPLANSAWYADPIVIVFAILALWVVLDLAVALVRHVQHTHPHYFLVHRSARPRTAQLAEGHAHLSR